MMKPLYSTGALAFASLSDEPPPNRDFQKDMGTSLTRDCNASEASAKSGPPGSGRRQDHTQYAPIEPLQQAPVQRHRGPTQSLVRFLFGRATATLTHQ